MILARVHNILTASPICVFMDYSKLRKESRDSSSQFRTAQVKLEFQWVKAPEETKKSDTKASFSQAIK